MTGGRRVWSVVSWVSLESSMLYVSYFSFVLVVTMVESSEGCVGSLAKKLVVMKFV